MQNQYYLNFILYFFTWKNHQFCSRNILKFTFTTNDFGYNVLRFT